MPTTAMSTTVTTPTWKSPSHAQAHSHSHSHSHSRAARPSPTPRGHPAASAGQAKPPMLSSPHASKIGAARSPSPSYFGFVVGGDDSIPPDSNPGHHARQNWSVSSPAPRHTPATARPIAADQNPEFEAFRRKSEQQRFSLSQSVGGVHRPAPSRTGSSVAPEARPSASMASPRTRHDAPEDQTSFFDLPRRQSPVATPAAFNIADHQHARLSLPSSNLQTPPLNMARQLARSDTLPEIGKRDEPTMISPRQAADLIEGWPHDVLVLDLRVFQHYSAARLRGALNLCIPTTLLKRPTFTVQKLADTFTHDHDRDQFEKWPKCRFIIVYDANSTLHKEAIVPVNVLKKFANEGWKGAGLVVKGGFLAFAKAHPSLVDTHPVHPHNDRTKQPLSISPPTQGSLPVAGGCSMPSAKSAANPFFGNIRQNMDLLDGVGQMPIKRPADMSAESDAALPAWLRKAAKTKDEGKMVSDKFLGIEKAEQKRMREALSCHVSYGSPERETPKSIQVAGIEKGSKNRYNNIFPYAHTRVRLQEVEHGGCDYVNASHVKASCSNRHYIATQAPVPATFTDFWRMVWEQDVRVIVMLTAESEGGQVKSHPYWQAREYGPFKLKSLSERKVSLERKESPAAAAAALRPSLGQRRSTNPHTPTEKKVAKDGSAPAEPPAVIVRHFTLSHSGRPFQPMREITQLQYSQWPDFGAPAEPGAILELIEQVNKYVRNSSSPTAATARDEPAPVGERPLVVHCSAGCGRTGTFCTIDSVIDMLKRQRAGRRATHDDEMDVDTHHEWLGRDDVDLVARTVDDFRRQRLSMVQNLRQFVLCYESVLQWVVAQQPDSMKAKDRRSYHG